MEEIESDNFQTAWHLPALGLLDCVMFNLQSSSPIDFFVELFVNLYKLLVRFSILALFRILFEIAKPIGITLAIVGLLIPIKNLKIMYQNLAEILVLIICYIITDYIILNGMIKEGHHVYILLAVAFFFLAHKVIGWIFGPDVKALNSQNVTSPLVKPDSEGSSLLSQSRSPSPSNYSFTNENETSRFSLHGVTFADNSLYQQIDNSNYVVDNHNVNYTHRNLRTRLNRNLHCNNFRHSFDEARLSTNANNNASIGLWPIRPHNLNENVPQPHVVTTNKNNFSLIDHNNNINNDNNTTLTIDRPNLTTAPDPAQRIGQFWSRFGGSYLPPRESDRPSLESSCRNIGDQQSTPILHRDFFDLITLTDHYHYFLLLLFIPPVLFGTLLIERYQKTDNLSVLMNITHNDSQVAIPFVPNQSSNDFYQLTPSTRMLPIILRIFHTFHSNVTSFSRSNGPASSDKHVTFASFRTYYYYVVFTAYYGCATLLHLANVVFIKAGPHLSQAWRRYLARARVHTQTSGLSLWFELEWMRLDVPCLFKSYWCIRTIIYLSFTFLYSYLGNDFTGLHRDNAIPQESYILDIPRGIFLRSCDTFLTILAASAVLCHVSNFVEALICRILAKEVTNSPSYGANPTQQPSSSSAENLEMEAAQDAPSTSAGTNGLAHPLQSAIRSNLHQRPSSISNDNNYNVLAYHSSTNNIGKTIALIFVISAAQTGLTAIRLPSLKLDRLGRNLILTALATMHYVHDIILSPAVSVLSLQQTPKPKNQVSLYDSRYSTLILNQLLSPNIALLTLAFFSFIVSPLLFCLVPMWRNQSLYNNITSYPKFYHSYNITTIPTNASAITGHSPNFYIRFFQMAPFPPASNHLNTWLVSITILCTEIAIKMLVTLALYLLNRLDTLRTSHIASHLLSSILKPSTPVQPTNLNFKTVPSIDSSTHGKTDDQNDIDYYRQLYAMKSEKREIEHPSSSVNRYSDDEHNNINNNMWIKSGRGNFLYGSWCAIFETLTTFSQLLVLLAYAFHLHKIISYLPIKPDICVAYIQCAFKKIIGCFIHVRQRILESYVVINLSLLDYLVLRHTNDRLWEARFEKITWRVTCFGHVWEFLCGFALFLNAVWILVFESNTLSVASGSFNNNNNGAIVVEVGTKVPKAVVASRLRPYSNPVIRREPVGGGGGDSAVRASMTLLHFYFNLWVKGREGFNTLRRRLRVQLILQKLSSPVAPKRFGPLSFEKDIQNSAVIKGDKIESHPSESISAGLRNTNQFDDDTKDACCPICRCDFEPLLHEQKSQGRIKNVDIIGTRNGLNTLQCSPLVASPATNIDRVSTPCGHTYHTFCLQKWLYKKDDCPMCRTDLSKTDTEIQN